MPILFSCLVTISSFGLTGAILPWKREYFSNSVDSIARQMPWMYSIWLSVACMNASCWRSFIGCWQMNRLEQTQRRPSFVVRKRECACLRRTRDRFVWGVPSSTRFHQNALYWLLGLSRQRQSLTPCLLIFTHWYLLQSRAMEIQALSCRPCGSWKFLLQRAMIRQIRWRGSGSWEVRQEVQTFGTCRRAESACCFQARVCCWCRRCRVGTLPFSHYCSPLSEWRPCRRGNMRRPWRSSCRGVFDDMVNLQGARLIRLRSCAFYDLSFCLCLVNVVDFAF